MSVEQTLTYCTVPAALRDPRGTKHCAGVLTHASLVAASAVDRPAEVRLLDLLRTEVANPSGAFEPSGALD